MGIHPDDIVPPVYFDQTIKPKLSNNGKKIRVAFIDSKGYKFFLMLDTERFTDAMRSMTEFSEITNLHRLFNLPSPEDKNGKD